MAILDFTSGGRATFVLGPDHPQLLEAAGRAVPDATEKLRAVLQRGSEMNVLALLASAQAAKQWTWDLARRLTRRSSLVGLRGASLEPGARLVAHGDALQSRVALQTEQAAAFMLEVVQVSGGVRVPPPDFCDRLRADCTANGALLVVDETEIGIGRTGSLFAAQREKLEPDLAVVDLSFLPGVGGAAVLARGGLDLPALAMDETIDARAAGVALAAFEIIAAQGLVQNAHKLGRTLQKGVVEILETRRRWGMDTRGRGLVRALSLWEDPAPVLALCQERGLTLGAHGSALFLAPPITATADDLAQTLAVLDGALADLST